MRTSSISRLSPRSRGGSSLAAGAARHRCSGIPFIFMGITAAAAGFPAGNQSTVNIALLRILALLSRERCLTICSGFDNWAIVAGMVRPHLRWRAIPPVRTFKFRGL